MLGLEAQGSQGEHQGRYLKSNYSKTCQDSLGAGDALEIMDPAFPSKLKSWAPEQQIRRGKRELIFSIVVMCSLAFRIFLLFGDRALAGPCCVNQTGLTEICLLLPPEC